MKTRSEHIENYNGASGRRSVNALLGYIASLMLCGVPPVVCESVLDNFYHSVKKSTTQLFLSK